MILNVNSETFEQEVLQSSKPVLVDLSAVWCGPCKQLEPIIEELSEEWSEKVKFVKVDVDHSPEIASNYQVMGVPTLLLFKNGAILERVTGYRPKNNIITTMEKHL